MNEDREDVQQQSDETHLNSENAADYQPPRMVLVGKTTELIRGAYSSNYSDNTHDFYFYGE